MLSPNPDSSQFNLVLPTDFFIKEVIEKYSIHLKQFNYPFDTIQQMLTESLQSYDMPNFGFTLNAQNTIDVNNAGYQWMQLPKGSEQALIDDKIIILTFRHVNAFITYFMCLELFFARYKMGPGNVTKRKPFGTVVLETRGIDGQSVCKIRLQKCQIIGMEGLNLSYASSERKFNTFTLAIGYTEFTTSLNVPDLILAP